MTAIKHAFNLKVDKFFVNIVCLYNTLWGYKNEFKESCCCSVNCFVLIISGCSLENSSVDTDQATIFVPVISQISNKGSRALEPPNEIGNIVDMFGTMFLPQLSYFKTISNKEISYDSFPIRIFGRTVYGKTDYGLENDDYTLTYDLGEKEGYIEITINNSGSFSYKQYLIINFGGHIGIMYSIHSIDEGKIIRNGNVGEYYGKGQLYYLSFDTDKSDDKAYFFDQNLGNAKTYTRGTEAMVYGIIDPFIVIQDVSEKELFIAKKSINEITMNDLLPKQELIKNFPYERQDNNLYPMNDFYYLIKEGSYIGYLSHGNLIDDVDGYELPNLDTREETNFKEHVGYSFKNFGYSDSDNIYQFLGDSLKLEYSLIGKNKVANWDNQNNINIYTSKFTVDKSAVYMVPPGFFVLDSENKILGTNVDDDNLLFPERGCILELNNNENYFIGFPFEDFDLETMKNYSYLFKLE